MISKYGVGKTYDVYIPSLNATVKGTTENIEDIDMDPEEVYDISYHPEWGDMKWIINNSALNIPKELVNVGDTYGIYYAFLYWNQEKKMWEKIPELRGVKNNKEFPSWGWDKERSKIKTLDENLIESILKESDNMSKEVNGINYKMKGTFEKNKYFVIESYDNDIHTGTAMMEINENNNLHLRVIVMTIPRKGYGSKLLQKIIELAKNKGLDSITLEVNDRSFNTINLYKKFGFEIEKSGSGAHYMKLKL